MTRIHALQRPIWKRRRSQDRVDPEPVQSDALPADRAAVCRGCGAIHEDAHWHWGVAPRSALRVVCPACARVDRDRPVAEVRVACPATPGLLDRVRWVAERIEAREKAANPLERVVACELTPAGVRVTTTTQALADQLASELRWPGVTGPAHGPRPRGPMRISVRPIDAPL